MRFTVTGGRRITGEVTLAGAKNEATKLMIASLLTDEPCHIEHCPDIGDVDITGELCEIVGSRVSRTGNTLTIHTPAITNTRVQTLSRRNRMPILALGVLLARGRQAQVPRMGGDRIGPRPVDIHLDALRAMGASITETNDHFSASAPHGLTGAPIAFRYPSVMATEHVIMAAVCAKGRTTITNAAKEPEILDLISVLQKMGAIIEVGAHRTIIIDGVERLKGFTHRVLPDRNEAASFAALAVATSGDIFARGARQDHLLTLLSALRRLGADYEVRPDGIRFFRPLRADGTPAPLKAISLETDPHPGFMTDWQQPFMVLLTQAQGTSTIHETVYEERFGYVADLNSMGASITVTAECLGKLPCRFVGTGCLHSARVVGPTALHAGKLLVGDLRAGMAHLIAALTATGTSTIEGAEEIDRGYEHIDDRLRLLGADIQRST